MKHTTTYRPDIDGLRAVAVLLVIAFHAFPHVFYLRHGSIGVDIFFVISGFLITSIILSGLEQQRFNFIEFYSSRARRIFPALLLVLMTVLVAGYVALLADEYKALGKHIVGGALFFSNILAWGEVGYFDVAAATKPLLHLWSLGVEEQFYIVWPLLLWFFYKRQWRLSLVFVLLWILSFGYNISIYHSDQPSNFFLPFSRFWELLTGAIVYLATRGQRKYLPTIPFRPLSLLCRHGLPLIGLWLIVYAALYKIQPDIYPGWGALPIVLGTALIISSHPKSLFNKYILGNRLLVAIGLISYPLYLWHWPILSFLRIMNQEPIGTNLKIIAVAVSFLLSFLTYRYIEKPIRFGKNKDEKTKWLVALLLVTAGLGAIVYKADGLGFRIKEKATIFNERQFIAYRMPAEFKKQCQAYMGSSAPDLSNQCAISNKGAKKTLLILGDSHGFEAFSGIARYLENKNINVVVTLPWCIPPFFGIEKFQDTKKGHDGCRHHLDQLTNLLKTKKDITDVLFIMRGTYIHGHNYTKPTGTPPDHFYLPAADYQRLLQNTVDVINNLGKHVYHLTDNPDFRYEPRDCLPRPIALKKPLNCDVAMADVVAGQADYIAVINNIRGMTTIYNLPYFCPNGVCRIYDQAGNLLYYDTHHVSRYGSYWQAKNILAPTLDKIAR